MIHLFKNNGYNIVMDVNSGAVHVVDDFSYDLIEKLDNYLGGAGEAAFSEMPADCPDEIVSALSQKYTQEENDELEEIYQEILFLVESEQLFSKDSYSHVAERAVLSPLKAICLHVSHDCNLRCKYCFAGEGDYGGHKMVMSAEIAKSAVDFLIGQSMGRRNLEIDFFGGEPLLNFGVVKETVEYARSLEKKHDKVFRFTMTTNGILLNDETSEYLNKEMSNVVLSLDGRREVNDRMRPKAGGQGSYDSTVPKYQRFIEKRGDREYYVRGTFTRNNLDFSQDVIHMAGLGFDQLSVEPVVGDEKDSYAIRECDIERISKEYDKLALDYLNARKEGKPFNFFHFMVDLEQGPCVIKRLRGCGCGNEYAAVDPDGKVFPCHQFVGKPQWQMGDVLTGDYDFDLKKRFAKATVYDKEKCHECWAKFYCSGGCNANNDQYAGDILNAHELSCKLEKKRLECAVMIQIAKAE